MVLLFVVGLSVWIGFVLVFVVGVFSVGGFGVVWVWFGCDGFVC